MATTFPASKYELEDLYDPETHRFSLCHRPNYLAPENSRFVTFENVSPESAEKLLDKINTTLERHSCFHCGVTLANRDDFTSGKILLDPRQLSNGKTDY